MHDQVTARICVEYFTISHLPVFGTNDPTLLGFGWGIIATWWVGLLHGIPLAVAARAGKRPPLSVSSLVLPLGQLLLVMLLCATTAGILGWQLARGGVVFLVGPIAQNVPPDRHVAFLTDLWAHAASYLTGFLGGIVLILRTWRTRRRITQRDREQP